MTLIPIAKAGSSSVDAERVQIVDDTGAQVTTFGATLASTLNSFQHTVATGTATALATHTSKSVTVKASPSNADDVYIGASGVTSSTGFVLAPGDTWSDSISNTNLIYALSATAGQTLHVTFSN